MAFAELHVIHPRWLVVVLGKKVCVTETWLGEVGRQFACKLLLLAHVAVVKGIDLLSMMKCFILDLKFY